jgi:hypothetical protein
VEWVNEPAPNMIRLVQSFSSRLASPASCLSFRPEFQAPGTEFLDAETEAKKPPERPLWSAETEVIGLELETHHPVIEPVSAPRRERKFPMQRRARKSRLIAGRDQSGDAKGVRKAPIPAQQMRVGLREFEPYDWVVETVGLELGTHHPVIEPVSARARNGNFRCRDRGAKPGVSLAGDGYRDYQKRAKARVAWEKCEDTQPSSIPEDWMVVCAVGYEPVSAGDSQLTGKLTGYFGMPALFEPIPH